ncbi:MAG: TetR-like transcription factor, partial [Candidatus Saccharibacteria bacterium]|nr:TetR-like transcription factor [Candidatus Saccharibacteria bacterium]
MSIDNKRKPMNRTHLSKELIVTAAVNLADEGGIEALSMRKIGSVFGVEAMALYHHFASKD